MTEFANLKVISLEEVKENNNKGKVWTIIDGRIFDLTKFASSHPGKFKTNSFNF